MINLEDAITVSQAAEIKKCTRRTIYHMIEQKQINVRYVGRGYLVVNDDLFKSIQIGEKWKTQQDLQKRVIALEEDMQKVKAILGERWK